MTLRKIFEAGMIFFVTFVLETYRKPAKGP